MAVAVRPTPTLDAAPGAASLFERHSERIYAYCLHVLRDRAEAEDAVQTTFLNAHRALQRGVKPVHEYAWLHTIAKNACRMLLRTRARRAPLAADVDVDSIPGREVDGEAEELRALLAEALTGLPESQRRAVVLREWHGLTPLEIAARLGLSVPATYALLTRARRSLANALTTTVRGPLSAFNVGAIGDLVRACAKTLIGSGASKAAVAAVVATFSVGVGGVVVERSLGDRADRTVRPPARVVQPAPPTTITAKQEAATSPGASRGAALRSRARSRLGAAQVTSPSRPVAPNAVEPASVPETASSPAPADPAEPVRPQGTEEGSAPTPVTAEPVLPPLPGAPPLVPDLGSGEQLPAVELPPLPPAPELSVDIEVEPPPLPLP